MFRAIKSDTGAVIPWEYLPAAAGTYKVGQALTVTGGKLTAISAAQATTPAYICEAEKTVAAGETLPVTRVSKNHIYETTLSAAAEGAAVGAKLQVAAGGLEASYVSATPGTFEVVSLTGTAEGDTVRGRWA